MVTKVFEKESVPLADLRLRFEGGFDLFICAASYEERCLSAPLNISASGQQRVLILKNDDVAGAGDAHAHKLLNHFRENAKIVEITKRIAIKTADQLEKEITGCRISSASRVCVDVTCMTHETVLILFSLLMHIFHKDFNQIQYLYCPAKEYDPGTPADEKWLSKGIKDVRSVLGYPGKLLPSRKNRLLVLVGFEVRRASSLIDIYEPASLGLGYGDGMLDQNHRLINERKHLRLATAYPLADKFEFAPGDAYLVRDVILNDASKHREFNLIVSPMNSKISTIGAALAAIQNPEIQLCYAPASTYNFNNYSTPNDNCIAFHV